MDGIGAIRGASIWYYRVSFRFCLPSVPVSPSIFFGMNGKRKGNCGRIALKLRSERVVKNSRNRFKRCYENETGKTCPLPPLQPDLLQETMINIREYIKNFFLVLTHIFFFRDRVSPVIFRNTFSEEVVLFLTTLFLLVLMVKESSPPFLNVL